MQTDHSNMKLGKSLPVHDHRTLSFSDYVNTAALPAAPEAYCYGETIAFNAWGMMANEIVSDCTLASAGHLIMAWTAANGAMVTPSDTEIITAYSAITGYDPVTRQNNTGSNLVNVLNYWRKSGIANHKIAAYAALQPGNHNHIMQAVYLFGGCYIGLALPASATMQTVWTVPPGGATGQGAPNSWGGHAVPVIGYDSNGLTVVTWGTIKQLTWQFWDAYCDESYCIISADFAGEKAPNGFNMATLQADLKQLVA
jgi:hypothetical protein